MKTIAQLYQQYQIMASLQLHMYRVAAVASLIIEHFPAPLDQKEIISACLLHDMGNILKFDLQIFPQFLEPEGAEYWQKIQAGFAQKYGADEYQATLAIAQEIGVSIRTLELISSIGFNYTVTNYQTSDLARKVCEYADYRVAPLGITSLDARWQDLTKRYSHTHSKPEDEARRRHYYHLAQQMEKSIFAYIPLVPEDISEASAASLVETLPAFIVT